MKAPNTISYTELLHVMHERIGLAKKPFVDSADSSFDLITRLAQLSVQTTEQRKVQYKSLYRASAENYDESDYDDDDDESVGLE